MQEIKAGVRLSLKDQFSQGIKNAGTATRNFADGAKTAVEAVNKAFSGTGAALATLGVSFSVGSAVNELIKFDDKLTRIGLTADASAEQVKNLKEKKLLE